MLISPAKQLSDIKLFEEKYVDQLIELIREYPGDAVAKINRAIRWGSEFGAKSLELMVAYLSLRKDLSSNPEFEPILISVRNKHEKCIEALIRLRIRQKLFKQQIKPRVLASLYLAASRGMFQEWNEFRYRLDDKEFIRLFRTVLFNGVKTQCTQQGCGPDQSRFIRTAQLKERIGSEVR